MKRLGALGLPYSSVVTSPPMATAPPVDTPLLDARGRPLRDLRISVTDRCNFRCGYCMPRAHFDESFRFLPSSALLSFEELARVTRLFIAMGVQKIRLTGGEPLLRRHLERLVELLAQNEGLDLAITTNGALLAEKAPALAEAGLRRVTVSLDSLEDETFRRLTDSTVPVDRILHGIEVAARAGLGPLKINTVVRRGVNDHEVVTIAEHFRGTGHTVRFIEFMDVGTTNHWNRAEVVTGAEIVARIDARFPLEPLEPERPGEVARRYRYADGAGEIGIITSVSAPFCGDCSRARLSSEGRLFTCLFATRGTDLRDLVRRDTDDSALRDAIRSAWRGRDDRYSELRNDGKRRLPRIEMSYIGG